MNIVCLVKFVPDVDHYIYDYEKNILVRENTELIINPDDVSAMGLALKMKNDNPSANLEVVSMGPLSLRGMILDILRRGFDRACLISDKSYVGSDTFATSSILSTYLKTSSFDLILCGSHSLDGDTGHVPSQIAASLSVNIMSRVLKASINATNGTVEFSSDIDNEIVDFECNYPLILGVSKNSGYKLPFVKYENLELSVDDKLNILDNKNLKVEHVGLDGSLTKVVKTHVKLMEKKDQQIFNNIDKGVDAVFKLLSDCGVI